MVTDEDSLVRSFSRRVGKWGIGAIAIVYFDFTRNGDESRFRSRRWNYRAGDESIAVDGKLVPVGVENVGIAVYVRCGHRHINIGIAEYVRGGNGDINESIAERHIILSG